MTALQFVLPEGLEASAPPPQRDGVRLLVAAPSGVQHARFVDFARYLRPGDLVVVNTSATLPAEVDGRRATGAPIVVHFSSSREDRTWIVELRPPWPARGPVDDVATGETVELPGGISLSLIAPEPARQSRLWRAQLDVDGGVGRFLARHGRPIRYSYVPETYSLAEYQTVFAHDPGSAEMPSAGRPFTPQIVTDLVVRGIAVAPITLHTGVSSQEPGEPPQAEWFRVPDATARLVNVTRAAGGRVVAVGTTVTRALESAASQDGTVRAAAGRTDLVLGPNCPARSVNGLVTGWHAPGASHLDLLQAVAGAELIEQAYAAALEHHYRWHEFGDSCLLLP